MLKLEKLELIGFKSFLSRTEFHFDQPITAVVGPNGCGKSNIGDALNWVIGEQSVKSLRGDRMEDVIFNGSEGRKPLGMAEVSLYLRNGTGTDVEEKVVVTRRLFRSGESEYLMNGERCRLRDVQESLTRINVGSGVYSIIEQGKVDAALSSRPRERRLLIEEAAGIALYKTRKRQAETKLEATEANLLRVNDIVVEVEKQIGSLKRQAAKARRYGRLAEEITRHERILFFHEHARLEAERKGVASREEEARGKENEAAAGLGRLEARFEEERRQLDERDAAWRGRRDELHAADREMDRIDHDSTLARQQAEEASDAARAAREQGAVLAGRLQEAQDEIEKQRATRQRAEEEVAAADTERERLEEERRAGEDRIAALEGSLTRDRASFLQVVDSLSDTRNRRRQIEETQRKLEAQEGILVREEALARDAFKQKEEAAAAAAARVANQEREVADLLSRLTAQREEEASLEKALARESARREEARHKLHGQRERLRALQEIDVAQATARETLGGLVEHSGILSDRVKAPAHLEAAIETYLAAYLQAALMPGRDGALAGVGSLKVAGVGRAAFLPVAQQESRREMPLISLPDEVRRDAGFVGRMGEVLEADDEARRALAPALARAVLVTDLAAASRLRRIAPFFDYVTQEGDVLHTSGLIEGGTSIPEGAGVLTRRRLLADLATDIAAGESHLEAMDLLVAGLESEGAAGASRAEGTARDLAEQEKEHLSLQHEAQAAQVEASRARGRLDTLADERRRLSEEAATIAEEHAGLETALRDQEGMRREREAGMAAAQDEISALRGSSESTGEALASVRATLSAARQRMELVDEALARLLESDQELRDRIEAELGRAAAMDAKKLDATARQGAAAESLAGLTARREALQGAVRDGEIDLNERRLALEASSQAVREARAALETAREARQAVTLEVERVAADLRHLLAGLDRPFEEVASQLTDEEKGAEPGAVRGELTRLKEARDQMGPVNMMALDQFRELEERHQFLATQRKDLTDAVASLKTTIANINRASRERFMDAFEHIRGGFVELFRTLFGGGRADLRLLTGDGEEDVLECGLEIIAQPPGKRLQSVSLMSGGEKALTAIALLFAIFKYRPSPFCLLDEVDAPLDEANVMRFNELLRSMSESTQFVMITHNRRSMETADLLYGITMEEAGVSRSMSVVVDGTHQTAETVRSLPSLLAARHKGTTRALGSRPVTPRASSNGGGS